MKSLVFTAFLGLLLLASVPPASAMQTPMGSTDISGDNPLQPEMNARRHHAHHATHHRHHRAGKHA